MVHHSIHLGPGRPVALVRDGNHLWVPAWDQHRREVSEHPLRITSKVSVPPTFRFAILGASYGLVVTAGEVTPLNLFTGQVARRCDSGVQCVSRRFGSLWVTGTMNALTECIPAAALPRQRSLHQSGTVPWRDHGRRLGWVAMQSAARWSE